MGPNDNQQPVPQPEVPQPIHQPPTVQQPVAQPQPAESPVPPQQPFTPMGSAPTPMVQPSPTTPTKKPKKGLIIGLVAAGVALLVGLILLAVFVWAGPSKEDYKTALDSIDKSEAAWNKIASVYVSSSSTAGELKNSTETVKENKATLTKELDTLAKSKAVTAGNKEIKDAWKAVADKRAKLEDALNGRLEAYEKIYPIIVGMDMNPSSSDEAKTMLKTMQTKVNAVGKLSNENNDQYIERISSDLDELVVLVDKIVAMRQDPSKYDSKLMDQYYEITNDLSTADRDWSSAMNKAMDDAEIRKEMSKFSQLISDKYYKLK